MRKLSQFLLVEILILSQSNQMKLLQKIRLSQESQPLYPASPLLIDEEIAMAHYTAADGPRLVEQGSKMVKKLNPVYMEQVSEPGTVETNEGTLTFKEGDFIAHDPISGHVWPVTNSYVTQHYDNWPDDGE